MANCCLLVSIPPVFLQNLPKISLFLSVSQTWHCQQNPTAHTQSSSPPRPLARLSEFLDSLSIDSFHFTTKVQFPGLCRYFLHESTQRQYEPHSLLRTASRSWNMWHGIVFLLQLHSIQWIKVVKTWEIHNQIPNYNTLPAQLYILRVHKKNYAKAVNEWGGPGACT